jgi:hypothetical protein
VCSGDDGGACAWKLGTAVLGGMTSLMLTPD